MNNIIVALLIRFNHTIGHNFLRLI